ncbi:MAG TPA: ribonuclease R [Stellaceae bacterium]|jgi:ribonuclease R|nr:ribonuclease R [Stellaceae bacterium]
MRRSSGELPSAAVLVEFLRENPGAVGVREVARAFGLPAAAQPALRDMLRRIERSGELVRTGNRKFIAGEPLPEMIQVERSGSDADGFPLGRPLDHAGGDPPVFRLVGGAGDELALGERALARLVQRASGEVEAEIVRRLDQQTERVVGKFRRGRDGGDVIPADRRDRNEYRVLGHDAAGLEDDELVVAEVMPARRMGGKRVRIVERLGPADAPGAISRMTIASFEIPSEFPPAALAEAAAAREAALEGRADLRELALVTIDGSDARDFDDAVWAAPDDDPANPGGWCIVVAIADVASYVTPVSALDREAARRGNSVYFPDRVVPMLPEALSNDLCSLVPHADRPCLAAHLWIDRDGRKRRHRFERAMMRSAARLTYDAVQAAHDGGPALDIAAARVEALYGAFAALERARRARGALELDLPEHRVILDAERRPIAITQRTRHDSHRLIEEFMILANVAAAEELEARHQACMYRVHDEPDREKLNALRDFFDEIGIPGVALAKGQVIRPELFNRILERVKDLPAAPIVNQLVLRSQAQAVYSPNNIGHFGLALPRYAHFTSPIRRYADLIVHRALVTGAILARDGGEALGSIAEHISMTERRAAAAERAALERYRAVLLGDAIGTVFAGRISGVTSFGLFVTLAENGADGLIPISSLPFDYYDHDAAHHRLVGRRTGRAFALGDALTVTLVEADPLGGRLVFRLHDDTLGTPRAAAARPRRSLYRRRR